MTWARPSLTVWLAGWLAALLALQPAAGLADPVPQASPDADPAAGLDAACVLRLAGAGRDSMTLAELRSQCRAAPQPGLVEPAAAVAPAAAADPGAQVSGPAQPGVVEARLASDRRAATRPFSVIAHRPNYFLLAAWNAEGWDASLYRADTGDAAYSNDDIESQFQVSLKVPLAVGLLDDRMDLYGAYTNRSFWQVYNDEYSEPFRETNHEPELWAQFSNDWTFLGITNSVNTVGYVHQSNGQSGLLSRSWDRLFATVVFERAHWALAFKPWVWISPDKEDSGNPDIDDYLGHGEVRLVYGRKGHVFSAMLRNQLESGFDRGATEVSWSFPVFDYPYLRGYMQYFYGYGESLIDYNQKVNRIGVGISVTDWLD
jgi:phospholipase A1